MSSPPDRNKTAEALRAIEPARRELAGGEKRGVPIPWWAKIAAKVVLARAAPSYGVRKSLGLFKHGALDSDPKGHIATLDRALDFHRRFGTATGSGGTLVELGPGDSVGAALIARARGFEASWLIDVGDFATSDMETYRRLLTALGTDGERLAPSLDLSNRTAMLESANARYLTHGTAALADIPSASVDVLVSSAVLEHVARAEFDQLLAETFRVMKPGAVAHHQVDLMDHLGGSLNNLRFSHRAWESPLMSRSGFYTNRLRYSECLAAMRRAGFEVAPTQITTWPRLPTPRTALAAPFKAMPEDELRIAGFGVLLVKPHT